LKNNILDNFTSEYKVHSSEKKTLSSKGEPCFCEIVSQLETLLISHSRFTWRAQGYQQWQGRIWC